MSDRERMLVVGGTRKRGKGATDNDECGREAKSCLRSAGFKRRVDSLDRVEAVCVCIFPHSVLSVCVGSGSRRATERNNNQSS